MRRGGLFATLCLVLLFSAPLLAATGPPATQYFHLEAQPLSKALVAWGQQADMDLVAPLGLATRWIAPVEGEMTREEALRRVLKGTDLVFYFEGGRAFIEFEKKTPAPPPPPPRPTVSAVASAVSTEVPGVIVTGTKIAGGRTGTPVRVLGPSDVSRFGQSTIDQALQRLPEFTRGGVSGDSPDARLSLGPRASGNITFASAPNLRALGAPATLPLINGRRTASSAQGVADMSWMLSAGVAEVQIMKDGASAIYGTDAVGGVVNFILPVEPSDNETRARYGMTARAGRQELSASQTLGTQWTHGSIVGVASYLNQTGLSVDERDSTVDVPTPENIYPTNKQLGVYLAGRYDPSETWRLRGQLIETSIERKASGFWSEGHLEIPVSSDRWHGALSAEFESEEGWKATLTALGSREETDFSFLKVREGASTWDREQSQVQRLRQSLWSFSADASGTLRVLPTLDLAIAVGAEHRQEGYARRLRSPSQEREGAGRIVDSAYVELQMPLLMDSDEEERDVLRLLYASRYALYSDVGGRHNPRVGIAWAPLAGVEARATWGRSLRTPTIGEEATSAARGTEGRVAFYSFTRADGSGIEPVALLSGARRLVPETARHWTAGLTVGPELLSGWTVELTWFDTTYRDRIVAAPVSTEVLRDPDMRSFVRTFATPEELKAVLIQEIGGPIEIADRTNTPFGTGGPGERVEDHTVTLYDSRLMNAAALRTQGADVGVWYRTGDLKTGQWQLRLDATWTEKLETVFAPGAKAVDFVGTTGYPPRWKLSGTLALEREEGWSAALAVRVNESYSDTTTAERRRVRSSMIADAQLSYTFSESRTPLLAGGTVRLSATNLLDEPPPYIEGAASNRWAHYDTANGEPLGTMVSLEFIKRFRPKRR